MAANAPLRLARLLPGKNPAPQSRNSVATVPGRPVDNEGRICLDSYAAKIVEEVAVIM